MKRMLLRKKEVIVLLLLTSQKSRWGFAHSLVLSFHFPPSPPKKKPHKSKQEKN